MSESNQPLPKKQESRQALLKSEELGEAELDEVAGGTVMATVITNLANMRHEMLKAVANNLRA
jgi:hypothetical protein